MYYGAAGKNFIRIVPVCRIFSLIAINERHNRLAWILQSGASLDGASRKRKYRSRREESGDRRIDYVAPHRFAARHNRSIGMTELEVNITPAARRECDAEIQGAE
jgi:hypothetical protein